MTATKTAAREASEIQLVDATTGKLFPSAPAGSVLLSSVHSGWRGIIVEWHRMQPQEMPEHYLVGHRLIVGTNKQPIPFGWKDDDRRREGILKPGGFNFQTDGDVNAPRWPQTFEFMAFALDPNFVRDIVGDHLPANRIEFAVQRCASDPVITRYAEAFRSELAADAPNGALYADTLIVGFALHLLSSYAVARPRIPVPRGKLNSFQLRAVVDFILSNLNEDVSLSALAERANVSAFHFARQFRATIGLSPHQFVLRQRIQKSLNLIKAGKLSLAQIAIESGFHDQAHFTHVFRKVLGRTPGELSRFLQ